MRQIYLHISLLINWVGDHVDGHGPLQNRQTQAAIERGYSIYDMRVWGKKNPGL